MNGGRVASEVCRYQFIYSLVHLSLDFQLFSKSSGEPLTGFKQGCGMIRSAFSKRVFWV